MSAGPLSTIVRQLQQAVLGDGGSLTDGQLLECFLTSRDEKAFEALLRRHAPMVLGTCRRVLRNPTDADDAFQAVFLVLVRKSSTLVDRHTVGDWLYGVAYHTAIKARAAGYRQRKKERQGSEMAPADTAAPDPADDFWEDVRPLLDQELHRLPEKYRRPVILCDLEGKTRKEAAEQLGWPEGTVSGRLSRARTLLAQRLSRHGIMLSAGALALVLQNSASAAVPPALLTATAKAASDFSVGGSVLGVSTSVAGLTESVLNGMAMNKVKMASALVLMLGLVGSGAGALTWKLTGDPSEHRAPANALESNGQSNVNAPVRDPGGIAGPDANDAREKELVAISGKVPRAVLEVVLTRYPDATLIDARRETEGAQTVYDVTIRHRGQNMTVTLPLNAVIITVEKEISSRDLPDAVLQKLASRYPKGRFRKVEESFKIAGSKETLEFYEVLLVTPDRKKNFSVCIAPDGTIIREEK